jgi:hypothetical protein
MCLLFINILIHGLFVDKNSWEKLITKGKRPDARYMHTAVVNEKVILFIVFILYLYCTYNVVYCI